MDSSEQRHIWAEVGRRNFWWFLCWAFGVKPYCKDNPDDNWLDEGIHGGLCSFLQRNVEEWEQRRKKGIRDPLDIMVMMPRGYGKSTIGCAFDLWLHVRNPNLATVISSFEEGKSIEFLNVVKRYLQGEASYGMFRSLYGKWTMDMDNEREWRRDFLVHAKRTNMGLRDPSFRVSSVGKGMTGSRPDVFRLDDPIVKEKLAEKGNWIQKAREHLDSSRYAVKSNGLRIVYLTPYADNDVSGKILTEERIKEIAPEGMPLSKDRWKGKGKWRVFFMACKDDKGQPTLPQVYPAERLDEMEQADPDDFASQMMCNPAIGAHMPLSREDAYEMFVERAQVPMQLSYSIHCDTAFKEQSKRQRGDFNVIQVWGHHHGTGTVYFWGARRSRSWSAREFIENLIDIIEDLNKQGNPPYIVTDEKAMGGKSTMMEEFLVGECRKRGLAAPNFMTLARTGRAKEVRIRQAIYAWKTDKVKLVRGAPEVESLIYEMTRYGYAGHDDMADAAADVFHPDVYTPELGKLVGDPSTPVKRPLDELLWVPPGTWTEDETRDIYDEVLAEKGSDEAAILGLGMRDD